MPMHSLEAIEFYSQFHARWFESVQSYTPGHEYISACTEIIPGSWGVQRDGLWYSVWPPEVTLPNHGWKLHISACTKELVAVLHKALPILADEAVPFKFLLDMRITSLANGKLWPRGSSGKFVTVYPLTLKQFYQLGSRLSEVLVPFTGPYILSDRRWPGSNSVYYRYGGFRSHSQLQVDGTRKQVIASPNGALVSDERAPFWNPPDWVTDPFPEEKRRESSGGALDDGRFSVVSAISFSNRGGVYKGVDMHTGREVVLKEARPNVEIGSHRIKAIAALKKEYRLLKHLAGTGYFVQSITLFRAWEHAFLVEAFLPGEHIGRFTIRHNPLYLGNVTATTIDAYLERMRELWLQLAWAIVGAHERGIVLGDLSFTNVLVSEGRIQLCDLEASTQEGVDVEVGLHTPGLSVSGVSGQANDWYAFGSIIFGSIMLAHGFVGFHPPARRRFLDELTADLGLPDDLVALVDDLMERPERSRANPTITIGAIERLRVRSPGTAARIPRLALPIQQRFDGHRLAALQDRVGEAVEGIVRYLEGTADTARSDRLFPADLSVFETNPLSVAYGATGVLYALLRLGGEVPERFVDWILRHPVSDEDFPPGLYLGQAGIAWVLGELGQLERAVTIMRSARQHDLLWRSANVLHGAAGYGLACLKLWGDGAGEEFLEEAIRVGDHLRVSTVRDGSGARWPDADGSVSIGYARGSSGIALFLLYLSLVTRDPATLELGRAALDFDLARGAWIDDRFAGFPGRVADASEPAPEAGALSCYWDAGSAGIGTTLARYLAVAPDRSLSGWLDRLTADASRKYTVFPQLFRGLSGLGNFQLDVWQLTGDEQHLLAAWQAAEGILLFRIDCAEGIAFPGEQARRESADFATGAAGVGLFLDRLLKVEQGSTSNFNFTIDELLPSHQLVRQQ